MKHSSIVIFYLIFNKKSSIIIIMKEKNVLLNSSMLPYEATPFNEIKEQNFIPALQFAIKQSESNINTICNNIEEANFQNTLLALSNGEKNLEKIATINSNLYSLHSNDSFKQMSQEISQMLSQYSSKVYTNPLLFKRVQTLYKKTKETCPSTSFSIEEKRIIEISYKSFVRKGALLNDQEKNRISQIDERKSLLALQFSQNSLNATNAFSLNVTDKSKLDGMPELALELAAEEAKKANQMGWTFTLQPSSLMPLLTYCKEREIRETLFKANSTKSLSGEFSNTDIINEMLALRDERANLLGYKNHAQFVLEERMAKSPEKVNQFLDDLYTYAFPAAQKEIETLKAFASEKDGITPADFQAWDQGYYSNLLKQERFDYDPETFRPYFKCENVIQGLFDITTKLYGITFRPISLPVYHPEVKVFEVLDNIDGKGELETIGLLYMDLFPRETKQGGAWMSSFKSQSINLATGKREVPHIVVAGNFTPSTPDKPALLSLSDANTLFHEMGHALHGLLSDVTYETLASPNVLWDFVELPSQIMENWLSEKEALDLFAAHYETGEKLPKELINKWIASKNFMSGLFNLRQLSLASLDMVYHTLNLDGKDSAQLDILQFEQSATEKFRLLPPTGGAISPTFGHLFAGGYSAGYYSYKWAELLDADAFEFFKSKGIFDQTTAKAFRKLLASGNTREPMELYEEFRGGSPDPKALLRRDGLIK